MFAKRACSCYAEQMAKAMLIRVLQTFDTCTTLDHARDLDAHVISGCAVGTGKEESQAAFGGVGLR